MNNAQTNLVFSLSHACLCVNIFHLSKVSFIVVLIGASPNLSFLTDTETAIGRVPGAAIDRENPIDIDVYTHESTNVPGLYAMGPLTGDNFVR